ncbi:multidrug transporter [Tetragenococcus halophilus]|uniref:Multidrug transporter n=1 Tax=Tetragenococcus halophilus TaxID=51669 RepID=A0AB35HMV7_TETHA|nr:multidrug transporter [Tetragenococcus halophilus]MCO8297463.1 multidrug transporter [Tetragenococcus halophilus]
MGYNDFTEKDWKLFRKKIAGWQEAYMDKLNRSYIDLLSEDKEASEKFWDLSKRITEDKKRTGVQLEMSRSKLIMNIISLIMDEVISFDDLEEFSDDLQETIKQIISFGKKSSS